MELEESFAQELNKTGEPKNPQQRSASEALKVAKELSNLLNMLAGLSNRVEIAQVAGLQDLSTSVERMYEYADKLRLGGSDELRETYAGWDPDKLQVQGKSFVDMKSRVHEVADDPAEVNMNEKRVQPSCIDTQQIQASIEEKEMGALENDKATALTLLARAADKLQDCADGDMNDTLAGEIRAFIANSSMSARQASFDVFAKGERAKLRSLRQQLEKAEKPGEISNICEAIEALEGRMDRDKARKEERKSDKADRDEAQEKVTEETSIEASFSILARGERAKLRSLKQQLEATEKPGEIRDICKAIEALEARMDKDKERKETRHSEKEQKTKEAAEESQEAAEQAKEAMLAPVEATRDNYSVIEDFVNGNFGTKGSVHLYMIHEPNGWSLVNYRTPILYQGSDSQTVFFNTDKYSVTTSRLQTAMRQALEGRDIQEVDEAGILSEINGRPGEQLEFRMPVE